MIAALPGVDASALLAAPVYRTTPVDCPPGSADFLNSVMEIGYSGDVVGFMQTLRVIESDLGRPSPHGVNEPRPMDLDLLYAGEWIFSSPELTLPHPRMLRRRFVLAPLVRIRPDLILPGQTESLAKILERLDDEPSSVILAHEEW